MVEVELCHDEADLEIPGDFVKGEEIICQIGRFDGNSPFPIERYSMIFKLMTWNPPPALSGRMDLSKSTKEEKFHAKKKNTRKKH